MSSTPRPPRVLELDNSEFEADSWIGLPVDASY